MAPVADGMHSAQIGAQLPQEQEPKQRAALELEIRASNSFVETQRQQQTQQEGPLKIREGEMTGRLRVEQAKLDELSENLHALEQQLEPAQSKP